MATIFGDNGDNDLVGTADDDSIFAYDTSDTTGAAGGVDTVSAGDGGDNIFFGSTLTADDRVDGGAGNDYLHLQGDYSAGLTLGADTLVNVEGLVLDVFPGGDLRVADYRIVTADANIAAGQGLYVLADAHTVFNGSAETDGVFSFVAATSGDWLIGGAGDDHFEVQQALTQGDHYEGGAGYDSISLDTGLTAKVAYNEIVGFEQIVLNTSGGAFDLTFADQVVAAGQVMEVDVARGLPDVGVTIDASHEKDAAYIIRGGDGADHLIGSHGADSIFGDGGQDTIEGGLGADVLNGGGSRDTFVYDDVRDSAKGAIDEIFHLQDVDTIDLSAIDAKTAGPGNQAFHLVAQLSGHAGELTLSYDAASDTTHLLGDVNGDGKADFDVMLDGDHHGFTNFVL
jgi:Ca2+-binding RTX toxin-like protein